MSKKLLPACLILMLVGTDLKAIIRLSPRALLAMFWGSVGIGIGGLVTYMLLFKTDISRRGRTARGSVGLSLRHMDRRKRQYGRCARDPADARTGFSVLVIMDTIVAYSWMALLVYASNINPP